MILDFKVKSVSYCYEGGIASMLDLNTKKTVLHKDIIYFEEVVENTVVEVALQYTDDYTSNLYSFVLTFILMKGNP